MRSQCILYVEDDENEVALMRYAFQAAAIRHPLHVVADGQQAIAYLAGAGQSGNGAEHLIPCLVLLDLRLPRVSGLEVLARIRAQPSLTTLPVIMFSSSVDDGEVARAYRLRANSFINKPTELSKRSEFARLLKSWWLEWNQLPEVDEVNSHPSRARAGVPQV